jgi:hypothetical protein
MDKITKCISCFKPMGFDFVDEDGYCFDCANFDPDYNPNNEHMMKELLENTLSGLAKVKGSSLLKIKSDFVAEHVINKVNNKKPGSGSN